MSRRLILGAVAAVVLLGGVLLLASRGGDDGEPAAGNETGLAMRSVSAGEVDVKIEPLQFDGRAAVFAVTLDTHSVELSMDLTAAELEVDGTPWPVAGWDGDGAGGHHREGDLRFEAGGAAVGIARLVLPVFPEPVEVTWELEG